MPYEEYSTTVNQRSVSVATSSIQIAGPAEPREAIVVTAPIANRITLAFGAAAVDQEGIILHAADPPLVLARKHLGKAITLPIFAIADAGTNTVGVTEFLRS